jgi:formamidopyrimidine-DNA glycosylase
MPEKPEVITVAKSLIGPLSNQKIIGCHVYWNNIIAYPTVSKFIEEIKNQVIHTITTRGKFLVFELDDYSLLIHLRMEGKFFFRTINDAIAKHEHVELILDNLVSFRYHDVRKFGKMYLIPKEKTYSIKPLSELGYEYDDVLLTGDYLYQKIHKKNLPIKTILLDQSIIAGIGNIYDNEILFLSKISPKKKGCKITKNECQRIVDSTRIILTKAITLGGTTVRSFTSSEGVHGLFQNELLVHEKKICPSCGNPIIKEMIGGRGTYYCKKCQK